MTDLAAKASSDAGDGTRRPSSTAGPPRAQGAVASLLPLLALLALMVLIRGMLIWLDVIDFNSDEAVIDLMARHITQGRWPTFYYGVAYVGSLGATLIAGAFLLFGESIAAARVVQICFYAGTMVFSYLLARRILGQRAAVVAGLLLASPPVMVTLYTAVGIGAYGETLLFGSLLLWLGHKLAHEWREKRLAWLAWGCVAGLGFWSLGLIAVYIAPVGILWLLRLDRKAWPNFFLVAAGFALCSSPWWIYDLTHNHAAFRALAGETSGGPEPLPATHKWLALFLFNIPALLGLRLPWAEGFILSLLAPLVIAFYAIVLLGAWRGRHRLEGSGRSGALLLALFGIGFFLFFAISGFAPDVTGRYLLPLYPLLCITAGGWWAGLGERASRWGSLAVAAILAFNLAGVALGTGEPARLTTVYFPEQQVGNAHDQALIDFMLDRELHYGYSQHWVSYKIAFLSNEQIVLAPLLPFSKQRHSPFEADRYPPYSALARSTPSPVYVTCNQPWLDEVLIEEFHARGVHFEEADVGPYHIFYALSKVVSPIDMGIFEVEE
ncbi:MAG: glycosyltransferase family 39 protein [Anaerolineae bacterium]|nr:glycosyltransferase family 39 protein [Anaerolineae bacterium]